jgi:sugar phosphate isomerase/epimerase
MLPIGLWLSARAAEQLSESIGGGTELRDRLAAAGLSIVTLNGFPYQDFHGSEVKLRVYEPHWANTRRALHTQRLADLLPDLLTPGARTASISTLPLGWRALFSQEGCGASIGIASALLEQTVRHLARLEDQTGIRITVDLEPEPGCMLDRAADVVGFFEHALQTRRGEPDPRRYIGVCHDVCHAAVMFEDQRAVLHAYRTAGISVNKVQVSSAVVANGSTESLAALAAFSEPRYLHQTCVRTSDGAVKFFEDLPLALSASHKDLTSEWRTHFHVPIFAAQLGGLGTTQSAIIDCLTEIDSWPSDQRPVLEIETYAWDVLPSAIRDESDLVDGIAREITWCAEQIGGTGGVHQKEGA